MMKFNFPEYLVPPNGFSFTFPDGTKKEHNVRYAWYKAIEKHYIDNGIPMPDNWKEIAEDQACHLLPPGFCKYETGEDAAGIVNRRLEMGDLFRGMEVLMRIAASSEPLVDKATAEKRAAACAGCWANFHIPGCAPCLKIPDMVVKINGGQTTKYDYLLQSCGVCACQNSAAIWVKEEILAKGITPDHHAKYQHFPHCWKKDIQPA